MRLTDGSRKAIHGPRTVHARVAQREREDAAGRGQKTFETNELAECSSAGSGTLQHNTRVERLPPLERCGGLASIRVELTTPITPSLGSPLVSTYDVCVPSEVLAKHHPQGRVARGSHLAASKSSIRLLSAC